MNSIARHLRKTILKKHIGCIKELTRYSNKINKDEYCPFAIAYIYWRARLQGFKRPEYVDNWGTAPFFKERCQEYGYPVYSYKIRNWLQELQQKQVVLPDSFSYSRNTYLWVTGHLIKELIIAEFYRCLEYGLHWSDNSKKNETIKSIYSLKYMPKLIIHKNGNEYYFFKEAKTELTEMNHKIENTPCINSNLKLNRKRKKLRPFYTQKEAYEGRQVLRSFS
ncbi:hypothetical protein [Neobacillus niacini]|uniref:hypothetical protein n=1 Tax=Neobacillus niacini TaxID=86668 RepID=UPI0028623BED|nr:hypothetical protein [Neobacillus niacini]MDR7001725.1 hypothetical protein [Neobacillus niacini]